MMRNIKEILYILMMTKKINLLVFMRVRISKTLLNLKRKLKIK